MPTPAELRFLSEQGRKNKELADKVKRQEEDRVAREKRMEQAAKDHAEAHRLIANANCDMKWAADAGHNSKNVYHLEYKDYERVERLGTGTFKDFRLKSIGKIIWDHFKKEGFEMDIYEQSGPYDPEGSTPSEYYIRVSW